MDILSFDNKTKSLTAITKLSYAIKANNRLLDKRGFTPFQLLFGVNMMWDNVEELYMPITKQKELNSHIHAVNESRSNYLYAEAETKMGQYSKQEQCQCH